MGLQPDHVHFRVALPLLIYPGMQLYCATSPWTFTTPYIGFSGSPHSGVSAKLYRYRWVNIKYFRVVIKESYSRVNDSKQQLNSFIIYDLDSIARVNEICKNCKKKKKNVRCRGSISRRLSVPYAILIQSSNQLSYRDCCQNLLNSE